MLSIPRTRMHDDIVCSHSWYPRCFLFPEPWWIMFSMLPVSKSRMKAVPSVVRTGRRVTSSSCASLPLPRRCSLCCQNWETRYILLLRLSSSSQTLFPLLSELGDALHPPPVALHRLYDPVWHVAPRQPPADRGDGRGARSHHGEDHRRRRREYRQSTRLKRGQ